MEPNTPLKHRVVIVGGGFAGSCLARRLGVLKRIEITLIDNKTYFEHTPSILRELVYQETPAPTRISHAAYLPASCRLILGEVHEVAPQRLMIRQYGGDSYQVVKIDYDHLIIATGASYCSNIRDNNAVYLEARSEVLRKETSTLHDASRILVIGGGPVGVEMTAELLSRFPLKQITLVHDKVRLLDRAGQKAQFLVEKFFSTASSVQVLLNQRVVSITRHRRDGQVDTSKIKDASAEARSILNRPRSRSRSATVQSENSFTTLRTGGDADEDKDDSRNFGLYYYYEFMTSGGFKGEADKIVLSKGSRPNSRFMRKHMGASLDPTNYIKVNAHFEVEGGGGNMYALGDVASIGEEKMADRALAHAKLLSRIIKEKCKLAPGVALESVAPGLILPPYMPHASPAGMVISLGPNSGLFIACGTCLAAGSKAAKMKQRYLTRYMSRLQSYPLPPRPAPTYGPLSPVQGMAAVPAQGPRVLVVYPSYQISQNTISILEGKGVRVRVGYTKSDLTYHFLKLNNMNVIKGELVPNADNVALAASKTEYVSWSTSSPGSLKAMMAGIETLVLAMPISAETVDSAEALITAARACAPTMKLIIKCMRGGIDADYGRHPISEWNFLVEKWIKDSGLAYVIVRHTEAFSAIHDIASQDIKNFRVMMLPLGIDRRVRWVDPRDIAQAVANAVVRGPPNPIVNRKAVAQIVSTMALSGADMAQEVSKSIGDEILYLDIPEEAAIDLFTYRSRDNNRETAGALVKWYASMSEGTMRISGELEQLLGRPPLLLSKWLERNAWMFLDGYIDILDYDLPVTYTLPYVLHNEALSERFAEYLETQHSLENLLFWQAAHTYSLIQDNANFLPTARDLISRFILPGSPSEINMDYNSRTRILKAYKDRNLTKKTFDEARLEVYNLMEMGLYPNFIKEMKVESVRNPLLLPSSSSSSISSPPVTAPLPPTSNTATPDTSPVIGGAARFDSPQFASAVKNAPALARRPQQSMTSSISFISSAPLIGSVSARVNGTGTTPSPTKEPATTPEGASHPLITAGSAPAASTLARVPSPTFPATSLASTSTTVTPATTTATTPTTPKRTPPPIPARTGRMNSSMTDLRTAAIASGLMPRDAEGAPQPQSQPQAINKSTLSTSSNSLLRSPSPPSPLNFSPDQQSPQLAATMPHASSHSSLGLSTPVPIPSANISVSFNGTPSAKEAASSAPSVIMGAVGVGAAGRRASKVPTSPNTNLPSLPQQYSTHHTPTIATMRTDPQLREIVNDPTLFRYFRQFLEDISKPVPNQPAQANAVRPTTLLNMYIEIDDFKMQFTEFENSNQASHMRSSGNRSSGEFGDIAEHMDDAFEDIHGPLAPKDKKKFGRGVKGVKPGDGFEERVKKRAMDMVQKYLVPGAPFEVISDPKLRDKMVKKLNNVPKIFHFDKVQDFVQKQLEERLPQFYHSPPYLTYRDSALLLQDLSRLASKVQEVMFKKELLQNELEILSQQQIKLENLWASKKLSLLRDRPRKTVSFDFNVLCKLWESLPDKSLVRDTESILGEIEGPLESENEIVYGGGWACGLSTSAYPTDLSGEGRMGDPICDRFKLIVCPRRVVVALADGCNWGKLPYTAAQIGLTTFTDYILDHQRDVVQLQQAGQLLVQALEDAHEAISLNGRQGASNSCGQTTLLGGIVTPLASGPEYLFVLISIGDCKSLIWRHETNEVSDITDGNRKGMQDAQDPGGRIGPYLEQGAADLRNIKVYHTLCKPGDVIMCVSDGVHDNLDAYQLGKSPEELGISVPTWKEVGEREADAVKARFMRDMLLGMINQEQKEIAAKRASGVTSGPEVSIPVHITRRLIKHAMETTQKSRDWMSCNKGRLPEDYKTFPGKMDHITCLAFTVGEPPTPS
eukprot:TRINITY_DN1810_c0_g1_i2.p1 TRINITY_DN1810_c0_g1~~TRINITY_DN1810_c0_g1_i2.p1  ORF type:complete len:1881 (-),score=513.21 TRINITY_DN1810_c0_g1_i2:37-5679(-)